MTKNKRKNYQKHCSNTSTGNESYDQLLKCKTTDFNLTDFPALRTSFGNRDNIFYTQCSKNGMPKEKSLSDNINKSGTKTLGSERFPALHGSEIRRNSEISIKAGKNDKKPITGNESIDKPVIQKLHIPEEGGGSKPPGSNNISLLPQKNPHKKKRSDPVVLSFQDIISISRSLNKTKKSNIFRSKTQWPKNKEILSGNSLDSSNPKRSRGKHREVQKKKLTKLKIAIIKERIVKQKMKEKAENESECFQLVESIDFSTEIKNYICELNKRKNKIFESVSNIKLVSNDEKTPDAVEDNILMNQENAVREVKENKIGLASHGNEVKFTSKFREYCNNLVTPGLNSSVKDLIRELVKLQDRVHARDPIKAQAKRRHVSGMREVNKYLTLKKAKLIVIAPNLEKMRMEGGVYDLINELKSAADAQGVPYAFALDRYSLGRCTKKNVPVSAFAVLSYEGLEALFESTLRHLKEAKESFLELTKIKDETEKKRNHEKREEDSKEDVNFCVLSSLISVFKEELSLNDLKKNDQSEPE